MIINHEHPKYIEKWNSIGKAKYNGAYYYSREICRNIIPNVKTDRSWITINVKGEAEDRAIVFVHSNLHPENYDWLKEYKDLILICGLPETVENMKHLGTAIYIPLSVDVEEVEAHRRPKTKDTAYAGRASKKGAEVPPGVDIIAGLERDEFLDRLAEYKTVYCAGRVAIEAKILGCEVKTSNRVRFPDPSRWEVCDNHYAARLIQMALDEIDGKQEEEELTEEGSPEAAPVTKEMLQELKKKDLAAILEEDGIKIKSKATKDELIQAILDNNCLGK